MFTLFAHILTFLDITARAGGGGSSSGDGEGFIGLLGYAPMHPIGSFIRRKTTNRPFWLAGHILGWLICILFCIPWFFLGSIGIMVAIGAFLGMGAGLYNWFSKLKRNKKVTQRLKHATSLDPTWDEAVILARARTIFMAYQADWSARNWEKMAAYMTPSYHRHASLMIAALKQAKRINQVNGPTINEMLITNLNDSTINSDDTVTVGITARANDQLIDDETNKGIYFDNSEFTEFWTFKRRDNEWYLNGIEQLTQAGWKHDKQLEDFARQHGFYYSLDWGWLLIPRRGQLFGRARFGTSDINNHIIGVHNNTYLLQLYTYDPVPKSEGSYLIAQTNVPKSYGNILVRRKSWMNGFAPKGLQRISTEWSDFNKKYEVFASDSEGATSFELLHPAFMEKLEALPFTVNIEVVDNIVYLYAPLLTEKNSAERYQTMLLVLQEAYKQMKM